MIQSLSLSSKKLESRFCTALCLSVGYCAEKSVNVGYPAASLSVTINILHDARGGIWHGAGQRTREKNIRPPQQQFRVATSGCE